MTALRYAAWAAGGLVVIVIIIAAVGFMLPVKHRVSRRVTLPASPPVVYALITDVERFPEWRSKVSRVELLPDADGRKQFREIGDDGTITYVVEEAKPPERVVTRISDKSLPFGGRWIFTLRDSAGATDLEIVEEGEVYNPIFRFVSRFIMGHSATIDRYMADVGRRLDTPKK